MLRTSNPQINILLTSMTNDDLKPSTLALIQVLVEEINHKDALIDAMKTPYPTW